MKTGLRIAAALVLFLTVSGCSKTDELTDKAATNLVSRIKTPIEDARAVSARAAATREVELPK
jgi:hypothetical protein